MSYRFTDQDELRIDRLATRKELSKTALIRRALIDYENRVMRGEPLYDEPWQPPEPPGDEHKSG